MYGYCYKNALMQNTLSSIFWKQIEFQEEKSVRVEGERHKNRLKKDGLSVKKFVTVTASQQPSPSSSVQVEELCIRTFQTAKFCVSWFK